MDRLHHFMPKPQKWSKTDDIGVGNVVVFIHKDAGSQKMWNWKLGKIIELEPEAGGRKVSIEYFGPGKRGKFQATRCICLVSKIYSSDDLPVNTLEYFEKFSVSP